MHNIAMVVGEFVVTHAAITVPALLLALVLGVGLVGRGLGWLED